MARFPLRIGRSRSIWEDGSVSEIARMEFPAPTDIGDLQPSVYLVEREEADRARAEHLARLTPPLAKGAVDLNLDGLGEPRASQVPGRFAFTNSRHAEIPLPDRAALEQLITAIKQTPLRRLPRSVDTVMAYIAERVAANDPEWVLLLRDVPKWAKALAKWVSTRQVH